MLSVINTGKGELKNIYLDRPSPGAGEVLLKILQCGICGSDIQIYHGLHPYAKQPLVMGHECVAEVIESGSDVTEILTGDLVTVQPQIFCNKCSECSSGHTNVCKNMQFMGVHIDGFFSEYVVVPAWNVLKLDKKMDHDAAMLVEPVAVTINAAKRGGVQHGMRVLVIGAGTIGNLTAQVCRQRGAEVVITDIQDSKLALAGNCGILHCVNTSRTDLRVCIEKGVNGKKFDLIVDCAAIPSVFEEIVQYIPGGSGIAVVGNYKQKIKVDLSKIQRKEINVYGVMQYSREEFSCAIQMLKNGEIKVKEIISARFPLEKLNDAFTYISGHPETMKVAVMI